MVDEVMKFITEADPEVGEAIEAEAARQRRKIRWNYPYLCKTLIKIESL